MDRAKLSRWLIALNDAGLTDSDDPDLETLIAAFANQTREPEPTAPRVDATGAQPAPAGGR